VPPNFSTTLLTAKSFVIQGAHTNKATIMKATTIALVMVLIYKSVICDLIFFILVEVKILTKRTDQNQE